MWASFLSIPSHHHRPSQKVCLDLEAVSIPLSQRHWDWSLASGLATSLLFPFSTSAFILCSLEWSLQTLMKVIGCGLSAVRPRWGQGRTPRESPVCSASHRRSGEGKMFLSISVSCLGENERWKQGPPWGQECRANAPPTMAAGTTKRHASLASDATLSQPTPLAPGCPSESWPSCLTFGFSWGRCLFSLLPPTNVDKRRPFPEVSDLARECSPSPWQHWDLLASPSLVSPDGHS